MLRKILISVALLLILAGGMAVWLPAFLWPNRIVIQNSSGLELFDCRLSMRDLQEKPILYERISRLGPDESVTIRHSASDSRADLTFVHAGKEHHYQEVYIDLWRGEGWKFEICPEGVVKSGYDLPRSD